MITSTLNECCKLVAYAALLALCLSPTSSAAAAPQHTATRLGNPATRFADPLRTPADLRRMLLSETLRADVRTILGLSGYQGSWEDFRRAVAEATVNELKIPTGTLLPAMSSREKGRAILLHDVLWAGREPIEAYEFFFSSKDRRYRVVTPKPCSNFWVEDQGSEIRRNLELIAVAPPEATVCNPLEMAITVRNSGNIPLSQIQLTDRLPPGLLTADNPTTLTLDAGTLQPGYSRKFTFNAQAVKPGKYDTQIRASSVEGVTAQASTQTIVRSPVLALECQAPAQTLINRPAQVCLTIRNSGDAPESGVNLALSFPADAVFMSGTGEVRAIDGRLMWSIPMLPSGASASACATFTSAAPAALSFTGTAYGDCAPPVESKCATRFVGIPAVLLEVVDLKDPIELGMDETYVITVTNQGSASLTNTRVTCTLEAPQDYVSATGVTAAHAAARTITFDPLPTLAPKQQVTWQVMVKAVTAGDIRFTTSLTGDQLKQPVQETEATTQY